MNKEKVTEDIIMYSDIFDDSETILSELNNCKDIEWKKSFTIYNEKNKNVKNLYRSEFKMKKNYNVSIQKKSRSLAMSFLKPMRDYLFDKNKEISWLDDFEYEKIVNENEKEITVNNFLIIDLFDFCLIYFFKNDDLQINFKTQNVSVKSKKNSLIIFPFNEDFDFTVTKYGNVDSYYAIMFFR
jgi:hypothetical protein